MISLLIYASNDSFSIQPLFNFQPSINLIYTVGNLNYMDTVIVIKLDFLINILNGFMQCLASICFLIILSG